MVGILQSKSKGTGETQLPVGPQLAGARGCCSPTTQPGIGLLPAAGNSSPLSARARSLNPPHIHVSPSKEQKERWHAEGKVPVVLSPAGEAPAPRNLLPHTLLCVGP